MHLPRVTNEEELDQFIEDGPAVEAVLSALGPRVGLTEPLTRPQRGSAVVGMTGDEVVKLMAPIDAELSQSEQACLDALAGRLPIPTPELLGVGEIEGWRWIRMSRLKGQELVDVWPGLELEDKLSLATQLGEALAVLHGLEAPAIVQRLDWPQWTDQTVSGLEATQRALGCPEPLLEGLQDFVEGTDLRPGRVGWLHTEVMLEHLLVAKASGGWRLSGLFDFEPSWVAPCDYEFAAVGLFVSGGHRGVLSAALDGYGHAPDPRRLFAMAMLHRYSNLAWYHRRLGGPTSLPALAEAWFGH
jgi:hygromycin-B 7''-O-kinase